MLDYHIHTKLCGHAVGEMEAYVRQALTRELLEIGFADHLPMLKWAQPEYAMSAEQLPLYVEEVQRLRQLYPQLTIKLGIEADYYSETEEESTRELLAQHPFDYVYGSVHFVDGWAIDDQNNLSCWKEYDVDVLYARYFAQLQKTARSELFDIISHTDLVKKFGHRPSADPTQLFEKTARCYKQHNLAVEINSSGLRRPVKEIYPAPGFIRLLKDYDVPIVFGSDAHSPEEVGKDFTLVKRVVKDCGYREIVIFSQRKIVDSYPL